MTVLSGLTVLRARWGVHRRRVFAVVLMTVASFAAPGVVPLPGVDQPVAEAAGVSQSDWLGSVNAYRAMSGLGSVSHQPAWDAGTRQHSCYMVQNGIAHDEIPGRPGYTAAGDEAGNSSNVALGGGTSLTPQDFVNLWMAAPFHALGMLRPGWTQTSYGECRMPNSRGNTMSGASIDIIRGLNDRNRSSSPVVFPGNGSTVPLYRFVAEYPDPVSLCGWSGAAGLPLIAAMPSDFSSASSTLTGPKGRIQTCTLHPNNTSGLARDILKWDKAVVVMPREHLEDGRYTVSVQTSSGSANWSFTVARDGGLNSGGGSRPTTTPNTPAPTTTQAPIKLQTTQRLADGAELQVMEPRRQIDTRKNLGTTRLRGGSVRRVVIASRDVEAVTANFTAVNPSDLGHLKVYDCASTPPNSSTLNYAPGRAVANLATIGLDNGAICFLSHTDVDLIMDITGFLNDGKSSLSSYTPIEARRAFDSRNTGSMLAARRTQRIDLTPGFVPSGSVAVTANITITQPTANGHLSIHPCSAPASTSSVNYLKGETVANQAVITLSTGGEMCLTSHANTHAIVDITGYFDPGGALSYSPLKPIRLFDSRSTQRDLNRSTNGGRVGGTVRLKVANIRGIPSGAKAVVLNVVAVDPSAATHVTIYACDKKMPRTSNLNVDPSKLVASNGAVVPLSGSGEVCITPLKPTHIVVDVYGVWE